ncbi:MAG: cytidine deaminase [Rubrivivax sp.]
MIAADADEEPLLQAALQARGNAHAPYSGFAVGAALRDEHGRMHVGCNVENAAYPQGLCAEAVALGQLVLSGARRVTAVAVVGDADAPLTPCGGCRQKLAEFAAGDVPVYCADLHGGRLRLTLGELLPYGFGPAALGRPREGAR